ncbi:hypothetical protein WSM22_31370 [Cytophagales bacterium WSM2-2]|nr:hypothetical protein WSM22_31370 [Cytophagales bacterium WSM2-2]
MIRLSYLYERGHAGEETLAMAGYLVRTLTYAIMNTIIRYLLITTCLFFTLISCEHENPKSGSTLAMDKLNSGAGLRVGSAVVSISPENQTGVSMEGYDPRSSTGINDAISSRCIVIADDHSIVALIALDLIGITQSQITTLKAQIKQATGLTEENIFIHAIHTHSGPSMMDGRVNDKYLSTMYKNSTDATVQALNSLQNVKAIARSGISNVKTINRRNPERSVKNEFATIEFQNDKKKNIATILNFSCHPVVLGPTNTKITADYVHFLRDAVENELGGTALFFNGSLGNINPDRVGTSNPYDRSGGTFEMAKNFGQALANDILHNYTKSDTATITVRTATGSVDYGQRTSISILDLGIIQIASMPGEPLDSFGEDIKKLLPGPYKIVIGMTNDYIGYIVPENDWNHCTNTFKPSCYEETVGGGMKVPGALKEGFGNLVKDLF